MPDKFTAWRNEYNAETYDRYSLMLPKGMKESLKEHSKQYGYKSLNEFIKRAILAQMEKDLSSNGGDDDK